LDKTAAIAKSTGGRVIVTGHTDSRKSAGVVSNWVLSLERGIMVARHLEAVGPLSKSQVSAKGASSYRPIKSNDTEDGRAANRRVEIQIRTKDKEY
jgi:chemotaxis protein MotB